MRSTILRLGLVFALFLSFTVTAFAAKSVKYDRPTKKSAVTKQQTEPTTKSVPSPKTVPTIQDAPQIAPINPSPSDSRAGEQINWQVLATGGGMSTMGSMMLSSTIGQTVAGRSTMGSLTLNSGFQQNFATGGSGTCCIPPMRGDINYDGAELLDISDLLYLIDFMFTGGPAAVCHEEADVNGDGAELLDISDLIYLVDYMFRSGPEPPACP